ncbi:autotransporter outer membrane beta-barrel domain-containing protein [Helicobacter pametensis]|uniref:autotransporter outer membrane beta-barrel domain-containing protein n=1 Tax=Helicobacter pametensis TaxID=95149 RepID=UPI0013154F45|nr:autotransporter outer membrane beta-barrel domain-containing protein [Helicobacter pametensis]
MIGRVFCGICLGCVLHAEIPYWSAQSLASVFYSQFDAFHLHSRSLFARSGALRSNTLNNSVWFNEEFGFLKHRALDYALEDQGFYNNLSFGADTFVALPKAQLYIGGVLDIIAGTSSSPLYKGDKGSYGVGAYLTYFHHSRFFIDLYLKFFYATQTVVFANSPLQDSVWGLGAGNFALGINIGQRFDTSFSPFLPSFFFLEPSVSVESGYLPSQKFTLRNQITGEMQGFIPLGIKANLAFGYEWNRAFRGSLKGGVSLEYDPKINGVIRIEDGISSSLRLPERYDFRVGLFMEGDFILNQSFRFFVRSKSTFSGKLNTIYAMNLGMRFSFGKVSKHGLHSKQTIDWNEERRQ